MEGWIKLHRKSMDHWLYNENRAKTRREAWEDMLLLANHEAQKVLINGELIECKRGQSIMSLNTWAKFFKWSVQQVRTFFKLLENDSMIVTEGLKNSTRITICNYDTYQEKQQTDNNLLTSCQQTDNNLLTTNKNVKNVKNDKKSSWRYDFEIYKSELNFVFEELRNDQKFISEQEKFHPGVDIPLSLEKAVTNFWGTEAGWKHKKKSRTAEIDWRATLINAIDKNKVYTRNKPVNYSKPSNGNTEHEYIIH